MQAAPKRRKSRNFAAENDVFTVSGTSSEIPPDLVTAKQGDEESILYWMLRNLFNFTIASCLYFMCCLKLKQRAQKLTGDETDSEHVVLLDQEEARIKERLRFHFMNPFQKWRYPARRRFPWKFILQILSTILVTFQVALFAQSKFKLTYFLSQNVETFHSMFVFQDCNGPVGKVVTMDDLYNQISHAVDMYYNIRHCAVGPFDYEFPNGSRPNLSMEIKRYKTAEVFAFNKSYYFSPEMITEQIPLYNRTITCTGELPPATNCTNASIPCCTVTCCNHTVKEQVEHYINEKKLDGILNIKFLFGLTSIYLDMKSRPVCTKFYITILLQNDEHSGSIPVIVDVQSKLSRCSENLYPGDVDLMKNSQSEFVPFDIAVIVILILSSITYIRSLIKSSILAKETKLYFKERLKKRLRWKEISPLYNKWFVLMLFANLLIIVASMLKIFIADQVVISISLVDSCSILLGLGVFLQWCGLLRFLSYFETYNVLLITLQLAMPSVVRFAICTMIFYIAFLLCGWLVLGPYHPKFRNPYIASEALFSLLNGDDMYNTYEEMSNMSTPVWIFSKIYLYIFISLFIYVVLSLFIGLIGETYETLTELWRRRSHGYLRDWAEEEVIHTPTSDPPFPIPRVRAHSISSDDHGDTQHHHLHHGDQHENRRIHSLADMRSSSPILVRVEEPPSWNSPSNAADSGVNNRMHPLHSSMNVAANYGSTSTNDQPQHLTHLYPRLDSNSQLQELAASTDD